MTHSTVVEQRVVHDGNIWTAAGVSAGIDLALAFIADIAGEDVAGKVQMATEYYPDSVRYGKAHLAPELTVFTARELLRITETIVLRGQFINNI